jgi:hypothetical protein
MLLGWLVQRVKILMMQATGSGSSMYEMKSMDGAPRSKWSIGQYLRVRRVMGFPRWIKVPCWVPTWRATGFEGLSHAS